MFGNFEIVPEKPLAPGDYLRHVGTFWITVLSRLLDIAVIVASLS
jgi:hypothetical protein